MNTAIYKITNTVNGKLYIGISANPTKRWWEHRNQTKKTHTKLYNAFRKYGVEAFNFEVLHWCETREDARDLENLVVDVCEVIAKGYNMCPGGGGGVAGPDSPFYGKALAPEVCAKMSAAAKRRGMTDEQKKHLAASRIGSKKSAQWKEKMSLALSGRPLSEEHKRKLSDAWVARKTKHPQHNATSIICNETGQTFASVNEAARFFGVSPITVHRKLDGCTVSRSKLSVTFSKVT